MTYLIVFMGAGLGGLLRYGTSLVFAAKAWPNATLFVNILGGLLMGMVAGGLANKAGQDHLRLFLAVGILGGFTTFSAFSLEVFKTISERRFFEAFLSVAFSVIGSILALMIGFKLFYKE